MRLKNVSLLLCLCFLGLGAAPAKAAKPIRCSLLTGAGIPVGGYWGGHFKSSFYTGGESEIEWSKNFATGMMFGYFFGYTDGMALKREFKNLHLTPYAKYTEPLGSGWQASAMGGVGMYFVNYDDDAVVPDIDDSTKRYFGYMVGASLTKMFTPFLEVGIDVRFHQVFRQEYMINTITPALSMALHF